MAVVLIGGGGFVGCQLALKLTASGVRYVQGGATNVDLLTQVLNASKPDTVIHLASTGMSGSPMLSSKCITINVAAAEAAVEACVACSINNLIYTSTYNVVFGGQEIVSGDESAPYFPLHRHSDEYSKSKAMAEQKILQANGRPLASGGKLKTTALRPAAIYGEQEQRHFPRLIKHVDSGIFLFRIGRALVDWVHVENLIQAFVCARSALLLKSSTEVPSGKAYFISDGSPIDNFEFLRPLCAARGCPFPTVVVPTATLLVLGRVLEIVFHVSSALGCPVEPFLTRSEVLKVGVTHYFRIDQAKHDFGYEPAFDSFAGAKRMAEHHRSQPGPEFNRNFFRLPDLHWWVLIVFGMYLTGYLAFSDLSGLPRGGGWWIQFVLLADQLALLLFRARLGVQLVFWSAVAAHAFEAFLAWKLAGSLGCDNSRLLWTVQTFILGYPSLSILYARKEFLDGNTANK